MWHIKVCNKITISISRLLIYLLRISLKLTINIWIYYTLLQPVQFDILVKIKLTLYQYWFIIWYRKQSDDVPVGISEMTTSQGDNIHRVDNVYMISPGDEAAAADSMNMRNRDGRSGSNFTNVYDAVDAPQEQPNSPDPPQPTGPLYSQVVNRRQPMADIAVSSSGLYDHIQSITRRVSTCHPFSGESRWTPHSTRDPIHGRIQPGEQTQEKNITTFSAQWQWRCRNICKLDIWADRLQYKRHRWTRPDGEWLIWNQWSDNKQ